MKERLLNYFKEIPVAAAVKSERELDCCLNSTCPVVFLLCGDLCTVPRFVQKIKAAGKIAIVHMDLVEGLSAKDAAVDYITNATEADGVISTKSSLIRYAKQQGLLTIQRYFLLDSRVLDNLFRTGCPADFLEVMPGVMPKIIRELTQSIDKPLIAGGMVRDREDAKAALEAGAVAVSSTNPAIWNAEKGELLK